MKIRTLFLSAAAVLMALVSCQKPKEQLGSPNITTDIEEIVFEQTGGEKAISLTATREWIVNVEKGVNWIAVSPEQGEASNDAQVVTITALPNDGMDRETTLEFSIGMKTMPVTVKQTGPKGSAADAILYFNDFDKEVAEKVYGSGESWPYLDQFDGWKNETGTGAANVEYAYKGMSARANSTSNSNYSDYDGSGNNNMFFGSNAYLAVKNIALGGATNITMTFGTEKYSQNNGSVFIPAEFHVFLSKDGNKWVELTDYTFAGGTTEGRWNIASATFTVPAGTENLSVCMQVDVASSYRMDDLKLEIASAAGTTIDFSKASEKDFGEGSGNGGGTVTPPANIQDVTVAEFNAAAVSTQNWYRLSGTVGNGTINTTYGNFDLVDETGSVYVYGISNWAEYKDKVAKGGTIVVVGQRGDYNGKIEVLEGYIESYDGSTAGGGDSTTPPAAEATVTVKEFLAAAEGSTWYQLTGKIEGLKNTTYGNFNLVDETGSVYVYGLTATYTGSNDKSFSTLGLKEGDTVTLIGQRASYSGSPQVGGPAFYVSHVAGEGGDEGGNDNPPAGEPGEYDSNISWELGNNAYDGTSSTAQKAKVNGVSVSNILKLGKSKAGGDCTITIPAGTKKIVFYAVAWKNKSTNLSVVGTDISISPRANDGATGNPEPEYIITVTDEDYYEFEVNLTEETKLQVATDSERALIFGLKAIKE